MPQRKLDILSDFITLLKSKGIEVCVWNDLIDIIDKYLHQLDTLDGEDK